MNKGINLLDYKNKPIPVKNDKMQKRLRFIALLMLFFVSAISMLFFILIALSPIPELRRQQKAASARLSQESRDIVKFALIKERLVNIRERVDKRSSYDNALENFQEKVPQGVSIKSVSIYRKDVTITLASNSLLLLDRFLSDVINVSNSGKEFSNIKLLNLAAERNKSSFLLVISLNII